MITASFSRISFQSTPSARRATHYAELTGMLAEKFQSTPSARRATQGIHDALALGGISNHALREEGDEVAVPGLVHAVVISIHALREEGDNTWAAADTTSTYFNPRPPRGGRRLPSRG